MIYKMTKLQTIYLQLLGYFHLKSDLQILGLYEFSLTTNFSQSVFENKCLLCQCGAINLHDNFRTTSKLYFVQVGG